MTTRRAPLSVQFITRDRIEGLSRAVASVRPYVEEIVIVDTGSTMPSAIEHAHSLADAFGVFTDCNDHQGLIESFAEARNEALSMSNRPWSMWMDSDDELLGGEHLPDIIEHLTASHRPGDLTIASFDYTEGHHRWTRDRIVNTAGIIRWHWVGDLHEHLEAVWQRNDPRGPFAQKTHLPLLTMVHHRTETGREPGRDLRILRAILARRGYLSPREMFYLGREHANAQRWPEAVEWFTRCAAASMWPDERAAALMYLSDLAAGRLDLQSSLEHAHAASREVQWAEPHVQIARVHQMWAMRAGDIPGHARNHVRASLAACEEAEFLPAGAAVSPLFTDRTVTLVDLPNIHAYALAKSEGVDEAVVKLETALKNLKLHGDEPHMRASLEQNLAACKRKISHDKETA